LAAQSKSTRPTSTPNHLPLQVKNHQIPNSFWLDRPDKAVAPETDDERGR
jgi:hypothetical protein